MVSQRNKLLFLGVILSFLLSNGQINDARLWLKAGLEKKLSRKLSTNLDICSRFGENYSRLDAFYTSFSASYKYKKWIGFSVAYRYSTKRGEDMDYDIRNRFSLDVEFKKKLSHGIIIQPRLRLQRQFSSYYTSEMGKIPNDYIRPKLEIIKDMDKKYKPYLSAELYYKMQFQQYEFNRVRYTMGLSYQINKHHQLNSYFMHQRGLNQSDPIRAFILGFSYKLTL